MRERRASDFSLAIVLQAKVPRKCTKESGVALNQYQVRSASVWFGLIKKRGSLSVFGLSSSA
jgi:hypothetical protein